MTKSLFAQTTTSFAKDGCQTGVRLLHVADSVEIAKCFTEFGWDDVPSGESLLMHEITPTAKSYAKKSDVFKAADTAGFEVYVSEIDFPAYFPHLPKSEFKAKAYVNPELSVNELLFHEAVVRELEANGFDAFSDHVTMENREPMLHCFWRNDTYDTQKVWPVPTDSQGLWMSEFDTSSTRSHALGNSPEEAVMALKDVWKKHCKISGAAPSYLEEYRDDIKVYPIHPGIGYLIGDTDILWHEDLITGDDSRFDQVFSSNAAPKP